MSTLIIGLSLGMLLFLLASGLTLIFGMLGVINFAHGALYMLGAYIAFDIGRHTGSFVAGLIGAHLQRGGLAVLTTHQTVEVRAGAVRELRLG